MELITKQYIVDENNRKIAVQIPIEDFEKIEQLLEDYALFHLMKDNQGTELLDQTDAETYYKQPGKSIAPKRYLSTFPLTKKRNTYPHDNHP